MQHVHVERSSAETKTTDEWKTSLLWQHHHALFSQGFFDLKTSLNYSQGIKCTAVNRLLYYWCSASRVVLNLIQEVIRIYVQQTTKTNYNYKLESTLQRKMHVVNTILMLKEWQYLTSNTSAYYFSLKNREKKKITFTEAALTLTNSESYFMHVTG